LIRHLVLSAVEGSGRTVKAGKPGGIFTHSISYRAVQFIGLYFRQVPGVSGIAWNYIFMG
jgi:hypothetical protein